MSGQRRTTGLVGLLLVILFTITSALQCAPAHARAADEVAVHLTSITPTVLSASGELVISGTITNQSSDTLRQVEVRLWRDATPLTTLGRLQQAVAGTNPAGEVMDAATARQPVNPEEGLAPGASASFTVRADLGPDAAEQLWLSVPDAAYQVGVSVFGRPAVEGYRQLGQAHALMPYPGATPASITTIVVLSHRPTLLPLAAAESRPPVFADDSLAQELDGRLTDLLTLAEQPDVWTVIDPALFDEVTALSTGHSVLQADGSLRTGAPDVAVTATAWLARLQALAAQGRLGRTLYGSVDVLGATAAQRPDVLNRAETALPIGHPLALLPLVVWPADGQVDADTVTALVASAPWLVLASNLGGSAPLQASDGVRLLAVTPDLAAESDQDDPVQLQGRLSAWQLVSSLEGRVFVHVVSTSQTAALESAAQPWRTRIGLDSLLAAQPEPPGAFLTSLPEREIAPELLEATDRAGQLLDTWRELSSDGQEADEPRLAGIIANGWSSAFGRDATRQVDWLVRATAPADAILSTDAIQLLITDWVTTSADDNLLPVTVLNNTSHAVQVRVHFDSENPLRISVDDSELFTVEPAESATVRVRPRTHGNGTVAVTAQLVTSGGRPVGHPASFIITGTEAGRMAWLIILASGAVLLVATAMRVRTVRHKSRDA